MTGNIHKIKGKAAFKGLLLSLSAVMLLGLNSCDKSLIYDYEGDCSVHYLVQFRYDYNMKYADAFAHEVESVTLYVIDGSGSIVWQKTEAGDALAEEGYAMEVDVDPGTYSLLAWCGTKDFGSFTVPDATVATGLTCTLGTKRDSEGNAYVDTEIDRLYYGWLESQEFGDGEGSHYYTVPLIKDTNSVRVVLQHISGDVIDKDQFSFRITADDAFMDWDNSLIGDEELTYSAWHVDQGYAEFESGSTFSAAVGEFTIARMMADRSMTLTVTNNETGEVAFRIPLIDIVLMVKGYYNQSMSDQEYLDRQDEYDLIFFFDDGNRWADNYIYINSWKVVLQSSSL